MARLPPGDNAPPGAAEKQIPHTAGLAVQLRNTGSPRPRHLELTAQLHEAAEPGPLFPAASATPQPGPSAPRPREEGGSAWRPPLPWSLPAGRPWGGGSALPPRPGRAGPAVRRAAGATAGRGRNPPGAGRGRNNDDKSSPVLGFSSS